MNKRLLVPLIGLLLLTGMGQIKLVTLKDGTTHEGQVQLTPDKSRYAIKTKAGITFTVPVADVVSVQDVVSPADEYRQRLGKIDPDEPEQRYSLAEWAVRKGLLQEARQQLEAALKLKPTYVEAALLLRQVEAQIRASSTSRPAAPAEPAAPGPRGAAPARDELFISQDDVYRIRLEELRATDAVAIRFKDNVLDRFLAIMEGRTGFRRTNSAKAFRAMPNVDKAVYMLEMIGRDNVAIKDDIEVRTDPRFMVQFRSQVWPAVVQYCGAAHCHGSNEAPGGLKLFTSGPRGERVDYTNFLILDTYSLRGWRMVNRNNAEMSLLVQFGLPPELAQKKHPRKIGMMLPSRSSVLYRRIIDWIESLKRPLHPDYRVKWRPPFGMKLNLSGRPELPPMEPVEPEPEAAPDNQSSPASP